MVEAGASGAAGGDRDALMLWLNACYRQWEHSNRSLVATAILIVWGPAVFVFIHLIYINSPPSVVNAIVAEAGNVSYYVGFSLIAAIAGFVAITAASCFTLEPEVMLASSKAGNYSQLLKFTKRIVYTWFVLLVPFPSLAVAINTHTYATSWYYLNGNTYAELVIGFIDYGLLALSVFMNCWFGAEVAIFVVLRVVYPIKQVESRTKSVLLIAAVFGIVHWLLDASYSLLNLSQDWRYTAEWFFTAAIIPAVIATTLFIVTLKPTKSMLERL